MVMWSLQQCVEKFEGQNLSKEKCVQIKLLAASGNACSIRVYTVDTPKSIIYKLSKRQKVASKQSGNEVHTYYSEEHGIDVAKETVSQ